MINEITPKFSLKQRYLLKSREHFLEKVYRRGESERSKYVAQNALKKLDLFCENNTEAAIEELKRDEDARYKFLDAFVAFAHGTNAHPTTSSSSTASSNESETFCKAGVIIIISKVLPRTRAEGSTRFPQFLEILVNHLLSSFLPKK